MTGRVTLERGEGKIGQALEQLEFVHKEVSKENKVLD